MTKPDFAAQIELEEIDPDKAREWWETAAKEFAAKGAKYFQYSHHPDNKRILLTEGWKKRPKTYDKPKFFLTTTPA